LTHRQTISSQNEYLRLIADHLPVLITYMDRDRVFRFVNKTAESWYGLTTDEIVGKCVEDILGTDSYATLHPHVETALSGNVAKFEQSIEYPDGKTRIVDITFVPHFQKTGQVSGYFGLVVDVSEQRVLESQLRQAQKMEAIGQLTGGMAHDFNNLLTVVLGSLSLAERFLNDDAQLRKLVTSAERAARRAANLTSRLLAFSRQQHLDAKVVDVRSVASQMRMLLEPILGEMVELKILHSSDLRQAIIDPVQLEECILNLAINARDAMPNGGRLTIETANVELEDDDAATHPDVAAGDYVLISVTDTGLGISPDLQHRVFDPFFTTKADGQGTGLGLSMVFGFIRQSGGYVELNSEENHGTCFKLYLPAANAGESEKLRPHSVDNCPRGKEVVLVVEDHVAVRETTMEILENLGYLVLSAEDGPAALAILEKHHEVDLLFTDMIMPRGMDGIELASEALNRVPNLKVLYTSGFSEITFDQVTECSQDIEWIAKPYFNRPLAQKIRYILDKP